MTLYHKVRYICVTMKKTITLRFTKQYENKGLNLELLKKFAKGQGLSVNSAILDSLLEKLELVEKPLNDELLGKLKQQIISELKGQ